MATAYQAASLISPALTALGPNFETSVFDIANTAGAAGFVINDTIGFIKIPPGALVTAFWFDMPQVDSASSLTWDVGTDLTVAQGGVDVAGFFAQSTVGRAASYNMLSLWNSDVTNTYVHGSMPFLYNQEKTFTGILIKDATLQLKVHTAPGTPATTGKIYCTCEWTMTNLAGLL